MESSGEGVMGKRFSSKRPFFRRLLLPAVAALACSAVTQDEDAAAAKEFFLMYFDEEWDMRASDTAGLVELFIREAPGPETILSVARGLEAFMARGASEAEMDRALGEEYRCNFLPSAAGKTVREWLGEIVALLRQSVKVA
jgi:hypothetical protein